MKKPVKPKRANPVAHDKLGVKGVGYRPPEIKGGLLVSKWLKRTHKQHNLMCVECFCVTM